MKALTYQARGKIKLVDVPEPSVEHAHDVRIKIEYSGLCGTDHKIIQGRLDVASAGQILGHEGVGTVTEVGSDVVRVKVGDRVAINPTQGCWECEACKRYETCYCENFDDYQVGFTLSGTFAEQVVIQDYWLTVIPNHVPFKLASLAEPLGCCLNTVTKARIKSSDSVLVIGGGPIGTMCAILADEVATRCDIVELNDFRRSVSASFGIHTFSSFEEVSQRYNVVIDAVGSVADRAIDFLEKGGRLVLMGYDDRYNWTITPTDLIDAGYDIIASVPIHNAVSPAIDILARRPDLSRLITVETPITDFEYAFESTMAVTNSCEAVPELMQMKAVIRP
ncbi:zinc-dependent alcohol dehydrogenase [Trueperella pyogenes]